MKKFLVLFLIFITSTGFAQDVGVKFWKNGTKTEVSSDNPLPVDAEISVGSLSVSVDPAYRDSSGNATAAVLTPAGRVPVDAGTITTTPSFIDSSGVATSAALANGKVPVAQNPLAVSDVTHYTFQTATGSVVTLDTYIGSVEVGKLHLIQARGGTIYIGGTTDSVDAIKTGGHKLEAGESFPIFRAGTNSCNFGIVGDAVSSFSVFIFSEQ